MKTLSKSQIPGWIVRIYHNLSIDNDKIENWKHVEKSLQFESHVDLCNASEIIQKRNLGDVFAMTWRWVNK